VDAGVAREVLRDLRRDRRAWRVAELDWVDALYKAYLTAIAAVLAVSLLSAWVSDDDVAARQAERVATDGRAVLGLVAAVAVAVGLRSGERGGPLAVEAADVRHVLLAPVPRAVALRPVAVRQLRHGVFVGAAVGAVAGQLAFRRLPGAPAGWVVAGAAFGAAVAVGALGAAMIVSGRRVPRPVGSLVALGLVVWSVVDVVTGAVTSPLSLLGRLGVAPLDFHPLDVVPAAVLAGIAALGVGAVGGTSLEASERRAALVGQMRFAVTLQDLRTVLLLRRQLAQELPRSRPWFRVRRGPAVWVRDWRGVARWPRGRVVRLVVLGAVAGLAARGAWSGTTPLVVVAGLAMFVAALDSVEPLGQDLDHPDRAASVPVVAGSLHVRHLATAFVLAVLTGGVGVLAAVAVGPDRTLALGVGAAVVLPAAAAAVAGAAGSAITSDPASRGEYAALLPPEAVGSVAAIRLVWPPALAVAGVLPVLAARAAHTSSDAAAPAPGAAAVSAGMLVLLAAAFVIAWVRFRDDARAWMREAMGT
jgi:hypothetical protein